MHGPSVVCAPGHDWRHESPATPWEAAVICELHIGTLTPEGTFRAAIEKLPLLVEAGYTGIDILPVAQFGGRRRLGLRRASSSTRRTRSTARPTTCARWWTRRMGWA